MLSHLDFEVVRKLPSLPWVYVLYLYFRAQFRLLRSLSGLDAGDGSQEAGSKKIGLTVTLMPCSPSCIASSVPARNPGLFFQRGLEVKMDKHGSPIIAEFTLSPLCQ